eukprot:CAMPEP_0178382314 /NCGR_PEP_ID=MMETSP0689_2-20121128/6430_1 /TAXON_ID=160604 /ORGANISM="Amphidinium massartii, Strain CS-259" /LENGTH=1067 /DNA_ID=CAMNT_0020002515 /DNA_START=23 /DNA_END=3226 /DNA_ORIENTATION=+
MAMSSSASNNDSGAAVWEANASFERQVAATLGQVSLLQSALVELASNHKVVADRLAAIMPPTTRAGSGIRAGAPIQHLLLPVVFGHQGESGSLLSGIMDETNTMRGNDSLPKPGPVTVHSVGAVMSTKSEQPLLPISETASMGNTSARGSDPARRLSGSYAGAASILCSGASNSDNDIELRQRQQLDRHTVYSNKVSLDRAAQQQPAACESKVAHEVQEVLPRLVSGNSITSVLSGATTATAVVEACWALHPHSTPMNLWEGFGSLMLLIDSFAAPWFLAFYRKSAEVDRVIYWARVVSQIYWSADIVVHSIKGYWTRDTLLELRISAALTRYVRSWCLCDVVLVAFSWMFLLAVRPHSESPPTEWNLPKSSNLYKVLLMSLWLAVLTNARKLTRVHENTKVYLLRWEGHHQILSLCTDIFMILCLIFNLNHVLSCLWYAIGELDTDTGSSWLEEGSSQSWSRTYFYATSLHWSISQMTPGSMEVVPRSSIERSYAVVVLLISWFVATTLTGLVNSIMTGERLRIEERTQRFMTLQRFFLQEKVEHSLAMTANMQVKALRQERLRVRLHDVQDLHYISKATREQLSVYIFGQKLKSNSFFRLVDVFSPDAFAVLCSQAVTSFTYLPAKAVFEEGAAGDKIIFVHYGKLKYTAGVDAYEYEWEKTDPRLTLQDRSWCSEAALWCQWTYLGSMQATEQSDCAAISAADLCKHIRKFKDVASMISEFSRSFLWVQRNANVKWSDLTVYIDHADIIAAMSRQARVLVGSTLLAPWQHLNRGWFSSGISEKKVQKLQDEISNGEGFVCLHDGEAVRTVFLVALRVSRNTDNKILVKLGQLEPTTCDVKAAAVLPGTKRREEETNWQATRRLVSKDLETLSKTMEVNFNEADVNASMQQSAYFGIRTRYLRTTYEAWVKFDEGFPMKSFDFKALRSSSQQYASPLAQVMTAVASKKSSITKAASTWHISKIPRSWRLQRGALPAMRVKSFTLRTPSSSSHIAEDILHSISELTIVPSSQGEGRHDVYVWLTERDYGTLQQSPEEVRKFLEVVWETEDWMSSGTLDRGDWHEEV